MSNISLYCLPYSGGSAAMYYKWRSVLSDNITLRPLEPVGRGTRIRQPLCLTMVDAVADLYQQFVKHYTGGDYAIFGHSLGGIMAFELVHYILDHGHDMPCALFFSGCRPPDRASHEVILHTLPDQAFMEEIVKLGGTPVDVFRNKELMTIFTPIIKNYYRLYEQYVFQAKARTLTCPIVLFHGDADNLVMQDELLAWEKFTTRKTRTIIFPAADHFFVDKHFEQVVGYVNQTIESLEIVG